MAITEPITTLLGQFSSEDAASVPRSVGRDQLESAGIFWMATVRPDGRPHVMPLMAVWLDDAMHFCTGPNERKAKNLAQNASCIITTGSNTMGNGLDIVVEGQAVAVNDADRLQRLAGLYKSKYEWEFSVRDGAFQHEGGRALIFEVRPVTAFASARAKPTAKPAGASHRGIFPRSRQGKGAGEGSHFTECDPFVPSTNH